MIAFQSTEIGQVPSDWEVLTVGELIENGSIIGHLDGNHGDLYPRSHEFKTFGVPYVGANDFVNGHVSFENCKFLSVERASQFRKGVATNGDVLFAHNATVGPVAMLSTELPTVILSTTATYYRCNVEKLVNWYLLGAIQAPYFVRQYRAVMAQSTRFQVPITAQRKFFLAVPPPDEQRAIAEALSDVDALLGVLDRMLTKKRDLKQAAMQQLLTGQTRLPGFKGEWEEKKIGTMGATYGGLTGKSKVDFGEGEAKYVTFMNVMSNVVIDCDDFESVNVKPTETQNHVNKGDLLFNGSSETPEEVAMCAVMTEDVANLYLNSFCFGFRFYADIEVGRLFMAYFLRSREGRELMKSLAQGSTRYNISKKAFLESMLNLPSPKEQTAIAEVLSDMDAEIAALERRREKTQDLKQGMMQELLTGKTRLV